MIKLGLGGGQSDDGLTGKSPVNIKLKESNAVVFKSEIKNVNSAPVLMTVFEKNKLLYKTSISGNSTKKIETTLLLDEIAQVSFDNNVLIKTIDIEQAEKYTHLNNINSNKIALSDDLYDNKSGMIIKLNADIIFKDKVPVKDRSIVLKYDNITISRYTVYDKNSNYYVIMPENLIKRHRNGLIEITADDRLIEQINIKSASIISGKGYDDIFRLLQETDRFISSDELPELTYMQGWQNTEADRRWGRQNNYIYLPIPENSSANTLLNIYGHAFINISKKQDVSFYSNDKLLYKIDVNERKEKKFTIKLNEDDIENGFILLHIKTNYTDTASNNKLGNDTRALGFALTGIEFKAIDNTADRNDYVDYSIRDISLMGVNGFYSPEETLVWADKDFTIKIPYADIPKNTKNIMIEIDGRFYFNEEKEAQDISVYYNNHLLKKFTAQDDKVKTYFIQIDVQNVDKDLELVFKTKYSCSPADNGESSDTRKLAFAVSGLRIYKPEIFSQEEYLKVSYSQIFNTGEYSVENIDNSTFKSNWYSKEPGLIWSSNNAALMLPLSKELQEQENIFIDLKGMAYFNKFNDMQTLGIYTDNNLLKEFEVKNNSNNLYTVEVPKKYIKDVLNLTIRTKYNSSPKLDGKGDDGRMLGFALTGINIRNDNNTKSAAQNEIKYVVKDIALMGGKGWYQPEQELIWSRKNAELLIPVSNTDNAATINITLKGQSFIDTAKKQKLSIYYKDNKVKEYKVNDNNVHDYSFTIDVDKNMEYIPLKIESAYEEQPKNTGESLDDRLLAFGIREIIVK